MKQLLLLHGAIGSAEQLVPLQQILRASYDVHTLNFTGHGGQAFNGEFSVERFANEVIAYLDTKNIASINIFGYSMGGYVALYLAKQYPQRVLHIITLATKFHWDEMTAKKEVGMLDADKIVAKVPAFAEALEKRHAPNDWKDVLNKTKTMLLSMGADNPLKIEHYKEVSAPVTILIGDRDKMVTLEETIAVYKSLPAAKMGMLLDSHHPIEQVDTDMLAYMIHQSLQ